MWLWISRQIENIFTYFFSFSLILFPFQKAGKKKKILPCLLQPKALSEKKYVSFFFICKRHGRFFFAAPSKKEKVITKFRFFFFTKKRFLHHRAPKPNSGHRKCQRGIIPEKKIGETMTLCRYPPQLYSGTSYDRKLDQALYQNVENAVFVVTCQIN